MKINRQTFGSLARNGATGAGKGQTIGLTLDYPPSSNRYWRKTRTGRVYVSEEAISYRDDVLIKTLKIKPMKGELSLSAKFYRPRKSGDLDNRLKILIDAMQGRCFENDSQIVEIHAFRFDDKISPRVEVEIREINSEVSLCDCGNKNL